MTTTHTAYRDQDAARGAAATRRHSGVPAQDILLLVGSPLRDVRREPVGGFAGPVAPDDPVGTFGGTTRLRRQAAGGFAGNPDDQRQGSFADTDRVLVITHDGKAERARITGHRGARRLLRTTSLDDDAIADRDRGDRRPGRLNAREASEQSRRMPVNHRVTLPRSCAAGAANPGAGNQGS
jgi:hypothetical protein